MHQRFRETFTPALVSAMSSAISTPNRAVLTAMASEQREKEDAARVARQRPVLRVCSELALVGIIQDSPTRSGGEWVMKALKELVIHYCLRCTYALTFIVVKRPNFIVTTTPHDLPQVIFSSVSWNYATGSLKANSIRFGFTERAWWNVSGTYSRR